LNVGYRRRDGGGVSSGFSTFSVLWAAGMHTAVAGTLALSAGMLMASAGTPYQLVTAGPLLPLLSSLQQNTTMAVHMCFCAKHVKPV